MSIFRSVDPIALLAGPSCPELRPFRVAPRWSGCAGGGVFGAVFCQEGLAWQGRGQGLAVSCEGSRAIAA